MSFEYTNNYISQKNNNAVLLKKMANLLTNAILVFTEKCNIYWKMLYRAFIEKCNIVWLWLKEIFKSNLYEEWNKTWELSKWFVHCNTLGLPWVKSTWVWQTARLTRKSIYLAHGQPVNWFNMSTQKAEIYDYWQVKTNAAETKLFRRPGAAGRSVIGTTLYSVTKSGSLAIYHSRIEVSNNCEERRKKTEVGINEES